MHLPRSDIDNDIVTFDCYRREKELREKDLFVNMFEIELPVFHLQMNQKDRANITKMILEARKPSNLPALMC